MRSICLLALCVGCVCAQSGTWNYRDIYSFPGGSDGYNGGVSLIAPDGTMYGSVAFTDSSNEAIYKLTPPSEPGGQWTETILYTFQGGSDGSGAVGPLSVGPHGEIYGTTEWGGIATTWCGSGGCGTVFQLTPPLAPGGAWPEKILYRFQGPPDADFPTTGVAVGPDGSLFGTTEQGGSVSPPVNGNGTVFQLTPPGAPGGEWTETIIHNFSQFGPAGCDPYGGVAVGQNGALYTTTSACSIGSIVSFTPEAGGAWTMSLLRKFGTLGSLAIAADGTLYGAQNKFVFSLTPPAEPGGEWSEVILHDFPGGHDTGWDIFAGPVLGPKGVIYGTTFKGGTEKSGAIYQLVPPAAPGGAWTMNTIYSFPKDDFGLGMQTVLVGPNGALYGGSNGGLYSQGAIFELTPPAAP
jgi:hypothetical protein